MESLHADMARFLGKMEIIKNGTKNSSQMKEFIKNLIMDVKLKDLTPSPIANKYTTVKSSSSKNNCMDKYTLQELKGFIKGKKQYKGLYRLNKKELCEKISNDLQMRPNHFKVKPGPKKK